MRNRLVLGSAVVFPLLILVCIDPALRWQVVGAVRGEVSYRGWPTSYWKQEIIGNYHEGSRPSEAWSLLGLLGRPYAKPPTTSQLWFTRDSEARAVLLALLKNSEKTTQPNRPRQFAASLLPYFDPPVPDAIPALIEALNDKDDSKVACTFHALKRYGPQAVEAVPMVLELLQRKQWRTRQATIMLPPMKVILGQEAMEFLELANPDAAQFASVLLEEK
jgi:hypothetical protein